MRKSKILSKLRAGKVARICCLYHPSNMFPTHAANSAYDGVWLDVEHNAWDMRELQRLLALHQMADIDCIVRPSTLGKIKLYNLLENGATGVLVPHVSTVERAQYLVESLKFPPLGERGLDGAGIDNNFFVSGTNGYPEAANSETLVAIQIETLEALENVEAIAKVEGIDVLFIGPGDLALRLGCEMSWQDPQMIAAQDRIAKAAAAAGINWGRPSGTPEDIANLVQKGARFIAHGSDFEAVLWSMRNRYKTNFDTALAEVEKENASQSDTLGKAKVPQ